MQRVEVLDRQIDVSLEGIAQVLDDRVLRVPIYQRAYSWKRDQVEQFWNDLRSALDADEPEYFLGTIVVTAEDHGRRLTIIDGQQRLATTTMLLAAIRNALLAGGESSRAETLERDYLASRELRSDEINPHLHLSNEDDEFFRSLVIERPGPVPIQPTFRRSNNRIEDAFTYLEKEVNDTIERAGSRWQDALLDWVEFLRNAAKVILVRVPNESDAFLIFETLNDRGFALTTADLLKNYLFSLASDRIGVVQQAWVAAISSLEMTTEDSLFLDFLRHFWSSIHGRTTQKLLYRNMRERIKSRSHAVEFALRLQAASQHYAALLNSDHPFWEKLGSEAKANVETLLRLKLEQNRPMLLAAMQHFSPSELNTLLKAAISWSVRGLIVGGIGGGTTERYYSDAAVGIRSGEIQNTEQLFGVLSHIVPTDADFQAAFATTRVTNSRLARYYLLALERQKQGEREPELVPNSRADEVNLEHILPRNARPEQWPNFPPDELNQFALRLGNLVLLKKSENNRLGNSPFQIKHPVFAKSSLRLTNMISRESDWAPLAVDERQEELAALAPEVWPRHF